MKAGILRWCCASSRQPAYLTNLLIWAIAITLWAGPKCCICAKSWSIKWTIICNRVVFTRKELYTRAGISMTLLWNSQWPHSRLASIRPSAKFRQYKTQKASSRIWSHSVYPSACPQESSSREHTPASRTEQPNSPTQTTTCNPNPSSTRRSWAQPSVLMIHRGRHHRCQGSEVPARHASMEDKLALAWRAHQIPTLSYQGTLPLKIRAWPASFRSVTNS